MFEEKGGLIFNKQRKIQKTAVTSSSRPMALHCHLKMPVIGPARASFVKNPTDGAHINLRQPLKNKAFYEAKVALHF